MITERQRAVNSIQRLIKRNPTMGELKRWFTGEVHTPVLGYVDCQRSFGWRITLLRLLGGC